MLLAIDASSIVAESFRQRGLALFTDKRLQFAIAAPIWDEAQHELERRTNRHLMRRGVDPERTHRTYAQAKDALAATLIIFEEQEYAKFLPEALRRIPRDPSDAPTVALALALDCGIWTADNDFFGCGVAVWATDVLLAHRGDVPHSAN